MRKITPLGFLILLLIVLASSGIGGLTAFVSNLWLVVKAIIGWMIQIALTFPDKLGIIEIAYTWILYLIICLEND